MKAAMPSKGVQERNIGNYAFSSTDYAQAASSGQANYLLAEGGSGPVSIDTFSLSS
jgi:hypothetical protein